MSGVGKPASAQVVSADSAEAALAEFSVAPLSLSERDRAAARGNFLETVVLGIAGADGPGVDATDRLARMECAAGAATVWRGGGPLTPSAAAWVNAVAASALDQDTLYGSVHADAVIVPVVIAVGERMGASGADVLDAHAVGTEIMCRLSDAAVPPQKGWTPTSVFGVFGAAAAAGRLMGFSADRVRDAMGMALSLAAGSQQTNVDKVLAKRLQPGFAARHGILSALAAEAGLSGSVNWLEGRSGLWSLYQPGDQARLLDGLGRTFRLRETIRKIYPVCSCSHAAMHALSGLMAARALDAESIRRVSVRITPFMNHMVGGAFRPADNPVLSAQFNLAYGLACIALRKGCNLSDLEVPRITDPAIAAFCDRIDITVDERQTGELAPAVIEVRTENETFLGRSDVMPGSMDCPMTEAQFDAKLTDCLGLVDTETAQASATALKRVVRDLGEQENIHDLTSLIVASHRRRKEP